MTYMLSVRNLVTLLCRVCHCVWCLICCSRSGWGSKYRSRSKRRRNPPDRKRPQTRALRTILYSIEIAHDTTSSTDLRERPYSMGYHVKYIRPLARPTLSPERVVSPYRKRYRLMLHRCLTCHRPDLAKDLVGGSMGGSQTDNAAPVLPWLHSPGV